MKDSMPRRVTICRRISFSCGHRYHRTDWDERRNREVFASLYSDHGFGHNFVLEAHIVGEVDPQTGMVVNLKDVDNVLREVTEPLDHHFLNLDVAEFRTKVPSTENIAAYCFDQIANRIDRALVLARVRLFEGSELSVEIENPCNLKGEG